MFCCSSIHFIPYHCDGVRIKYGGVHPRSSSLDCFTSALTNLIASAGTLSISELFGSGRVWVINDDDDPTGLIYFRLNTGTTCNHIWMNLLLNQLDLWIIWDQFYEFVKHWHVKVGESKIDLPNPPMFSTTNVLHYMVVKYYVHIASILVPYHCKAHCKVYKLVLHNPYS